MEQFRQLDSQISKIDLGALMHRTAVISDFDAHLQHLLLNEEKLNSYQNSVKTIEDDIKTLSMNLTSQSKLLTESQVKSQSPKLEKLENLCEKLSSELAEAKTYATICSTGTPVSSTPVSPKARSPKPMPAKKLKLEHSEKPVTDSRSKFLDGDKLGALQEFLNDQKKQGKFASENGHAVLLFGKDYHYTGARSRAKGNSNPIPGPISDVIEYIYTQFDGEYALDSVLVNHYPAGSSSYLPEHSDNEPAINPDSHIFTLSLGGSRTLSFREMSTKENVLDHVCEHNSLYSMSRQSQNFFLHRIDKAEITGAAPSCERFSLTFRCIDQRYRRSTIVLGDSNTKWFRFGEGPGTFGRGLPGKCQPTMLIEKINPADCMSYNNAVIQCGINDLTGNKVTITGPKDVGVVFDHFKCKIDGILAANPKINVFIVPLLPTRSVTYNKYVRVFNSLLKSNIIDCDYRCTAINVAELEYSDGILRSECLKVDWDNIHINIKSVRKVAMSVRDAIYLKYNSGRKNRINSTKLYSEAVGTKPRGGGRHSNS